MSRSEKLPGPAWRPFVSYESDYVIATVVVAACTVLSVTVRSKLVLTDLAMIYLLGVIAVSLRSSRRAAIFTSFLSVTAFHFFCVPNFDSFVLIDSVYISTLLAMLAVSLVISNLTTRIRSQSDAARDAEIRVQSERMKNALLSAISHDLKTPLASIYGAATSILEQRERIDATDRRELIESIAGEAERLNRLLSNLLEMTRLDSGLEARKDWQSLEEIVGAALSRVDGILSGRRIDTHIPPELPLIRVDDVLIGQVLMNLLENIAKYTPDESPVEIIAEQSGELVIISVLDRGPGFSTGDEDRVFEKFFRGKSDGVRGVGLGLAICRAIVLTHQGTIHAENRKDGGAVVWFELPIGGIAPEIRTSESF